VSVLVLRAVAPAGAEIATVVVSVSLTCLSGAHCDSVGVIVTSALSPGATVAGAETRKPLLADCFARLTALVAFLAAFFAFFAAFLAFFAAFLAFLFADFFDFFDFFAAFLAFFVAFFAFFPAFFAFFPAFL